MGCVSNGLEELRETYIDRVSIVKRIFDTVYRFGWALTPSFQWGIVLMEVAFAENKGGRVARKHIGEGDRMKVVGSGALV